MSSDSDMGTTHSSEHVVVESNDDTTTTTTPTTVPPPPTTTTTTGSDTPANNDNHDETEIPPVYLRELIAIDHASESLQSRPPRDPNDNTSNSRTIASLVFDGTPEVSSGDDDNDEDDTNALDHQEDNAINAVDATVPRANVAHDHEPQEAATDHDDDARAPSSTASIDTRVRVLCYNILAECYSPPVWFPHCPAHYLKFKFRAQRIVNEVAHYQPDIVCLQEVDHWKSFYRQRFAELGYDACYVPRPGRPDGCATLWKTDKFEAVEHKLVSYNDLVAKNGRDFLRDNIAIVLLLKPIDASVGSRPIVVANTHLFWSPEFTNVKLAQAHMLAYSVHNFRYAVARDAGVIVCGDFNSQKSSPVYRYLRDGSIAGHKMKHTLALESAYAPFGEPLTNFTPKFSGCLDYIWYGPEFRLLSVLAPVPPDSHVFADQSGLPSVHLPSDHVCLMAVFEPSAQ